MILALLLFLSAPVAAQITVAGPFTGLNDTNASITLEPGEAQSLLNVEVSEDGLSINKRQGYTLTDTLTITTSPINGSIYFKSVAGNNIRVLAQDNSIWTSVNGAAFTALLTTMTVGAQWDFCESGGVMYAFNDQHETPWSWNGTTITYYTDMPKASICAMTPTRMLLAGTTDYPNRLYFSEAGTLTNFTAGTGVNDPSFDDVGMSGDKITALYATESEWLIFKSNSFISYQGTNQYDLVAAVVSNRVGMTDPQAAVSHEGILYFKGSDNKVWAYTSGQMVDATKKIENFTELISKSSATISKSYTTEPEFNEGTFVNVTSSRTSGALEPLLFTYTDDSDADFNAGTVDPAMSVYDGNIYLTAWSSTTDPTAGYFVNMGAESNSTTNWTMSANPWAPYTTYQSTGPKYGSYFFGATDNGFTSAVRTGFYIKKSGTGDTVYTKTLGASLVWAFEDFTVDMTSYEDTDYYIYATCGTGAGLRTATSTTFTKGTITARIGYKFDAGDSLGYCYMDINEVPPTASSGTFISQAHTVTAPAPHYGFLTDNDTVGTGNTITYYVASASSTTGVYSSWGAATDPASFISTNTVYKWKAEMATTTSTVSAPYISSVSLSFQSTGYWLSDEYSMGAFSSWSTFLANATTTGTGSWTYTIAVTTWAGGTAGATFEALTSGSVITVSTGTYARLKALTGLSSATETVRLNDLTYSWNFTTDQQAQAFEYKGDIYFTVPYNSAKTNNRVMKLDTERNGWTIFDIAMNRPMVVEDLVYFGSPTGGYLYKYPYGESDNGTAIDSYWKTKDFMGANPWMDKEYQKMSLIAGKNAATTLNVTYQPETNTETTYSISLSTATSFLYHNRIMPFGTNGKTFNVKFGNNAADQPWQIYGLNVDYIDRPWQAQEE